MGENTDVTQCGNITNKQSEDIIRQGKLDKATLYIISQWNDLIKSKKLKMPTSPYISSQHKEPYQ